jgi:hypothetical protein
MRFLYFAVTAFLAQGTTQAAAAAGCIRSFDPWEIVHAQDVAYNAHDIDAFAACYADNVVIEGLSKKHPPIVGIAALKEAYKFLRTAPAGFHTQFINKIVVGPIVVVHEVALGGTANMPKPDWPAESIAIFEIRDSKVVHVWFAPTK